MQATFSSLPDTVFRGLSRPYLLLLTIWFSTTFNAHADTDPITVAELTFPVPGTRAAADWEVLNPKKQYQWPNYFYGFQEGDVLEIDLKMEEGTGTLELDIREYGSGAIIYAGRKLTKLKKQRFTVPQKTAYEFIIRNTDPEPATCKLLIKRIPASAATARFNSYVTWKTKEDSVFKTVNEKVLVKTDLKPQVLVDKTFRVFSQASMGNPSRVTVPFKIPAGTQHWVYWLGVGQESVKEMEELTKKIAKGGSAVMAGMNPVVAFGMGLLPELPQVKSSGYVDFLFMNKDAVKAFEKEGERKPYAFAKGDAIINAYGKIAGSQTPKTQDGTLYLGVENHNTVTGLDVAVKIIAFQGEKKFETRQVKKFSHVNFTRYPAFGE